MCREMPGVARAPRYAQVRNRNGSDRSGAAAVGEPSPGGIYIVEAFAPRQALAGLLVRTLSCAGESTDTDGAAGTRLVAGFRLTVAGGKGVHVQDLALVFGHGMRVIACVGC
jgi:hypothetical protein